MAAGKRRAHGSRRLGTRRTVPVARTEDGAGAEGAKWGRTAGRAARCGRRDADGGAHGARSRDGRRGTRRGADGGARGAHGARRAAAALKGHLACGADARQMSVSRETLASWIQMQVMDDGHAALRMGAMRLRDTAWGCGHVGHDAGDASVGCGHGGSTRVSGAGTVGRRECRVRARRAGMGVGRWATMRAARRGSRRAAPATWAAGAGARAGGAEAWGARRGGRARTGPRGSAAAGAAGTTGSAAASATDAAAAASGGAARRRAARWRRDDGAWRLPGVGAMTRWGRDAGGVGARRGGGARGCWGVEGAETRGRLRVVLEARCRPRKRKRVFHVKHSGVQFSF